MGKGAEAGAGGKVFAGGEREEEESIRDKSVRFLSFSFCSLSADELLSTHEEILVVVVENNGCSSPVMRYLLPSLSWLHTCRDAPFRGRLCLLSIACVSAMCVFSVSQPFVR